ncbi:hypothetical protein AUJ14_04645 [Candidatus Micrarchaeota archaeon CG1_02_55_22]|nr:MAG: hypothetical protein AUJ14_04645 [Candidatus Micrarchaeota archaeon CG1_02_55_22]
MEIKFLGGAREVGRSCFLIKDKRSWLLDAGVKFGEEEQYPDITRAMLKSINHVVLSHAHLDHSGYLPALYQKGYSGKVWCTKPTRDMIQLLLSDYLKIANERGNPPYGQDDLNKLLKNTELTEFDEPAKGAPELSFHHSGHILGSAMCKFDFAGGTLLYTGDFSAQESRLLEPVQTGIAAKWLITESTYGSKADKRPSQKQVTKEFIDSIKQTIDAGGKVIIPTFAVGRGQDVLFTLESHIKSGLLPKVPIYLDGMVKKALKIYRHNAIYLKREIQRQILTSDDDPFKSDNYRVPEKKDRSDVTQGEPCIILATSGMMNGGPVLAYVEALGGDAANKLLFVGYQAEGTLGRKILDGEREIELGGKTIKLELKIERAAFSAHADHNDLVSFARDTPGLEKVFIVHGDESKVDELARDIELACKKKGRKVEAFAPAAGEIVRLV